MRNREVECPYLDAAINEIMHIEPFSGGTRLQSVKKSLILDGFQTPKRYNVAFNLGLFNTYLFGRVALAVACVLDSVKLSCILG
jgi:hypothetical protein